MVSFRRILSPENSQKENRNKKYFFKGGVHPDDRKELSSEKPLMVLSPPAQVVISMSQHIGVPCKPAVSPGDQVKKGQKIGDGEGLCVPVHASVSGRVSAVEQKRHPNGKEILTVVIENDFQNTQDTALVPHPDYTVLSNEEILSIIHEAGIVGMGGAAFATDIKAKSSQDKIDTLIINGCECEPYITADDMLLRTYPEQVLKGIEIICQILKPEQVVLAVEENKQTAIEALKCELRKREPEWHNSRNSSKTANTTPIATGGGMGSASGTIDVADTTSVVAGSGTGSASGTIDVADTTSITTGSGTGSASGTIDTADTTFVVAGSGTGSTSHIITAGHTDNINGTNSAKLLGTNNCDNADTRTDNERHNKEIKLQILPTRYPQGSEKQLIQAVTGREIPPGQLPAAVGCAVFNVATCAAVYKAVCLGQAVTERIVTVTGEAVKNPCNFVVPIGTSFSELVQQAGGLNTDICKVLSGGPMMGIAQADLSASTVKGTNAVLCLSDTEADMNGWGSGFRLSSENSRSENSFDNRVCIRCGKCLTVCPVYLQPLYLYIYEKKQDMEGLKQLNVTDCIECGCCSYICPGKLPLTERFRHAKQLIREGKK